MNRCFFSNLIFITILIFVCNSYGDSTSLPLLTMDLSVTEQIQPESKINSISSTELHRKISAAKSLGATGSLLWTSGKILEIVGTVILVSGENEGLGVGLLIPGLAFDLFGPVPSCIGESIMMKSIASSGVVMDDKNIEIKAKGWSYYAVSWSFVGMSLITNLVAYGAGVPFMSVLGVLASGTGEVFRAIAAIAPASRINKASKRIDLSFRPIYDLEGNRGLVLSVGF